MTCRQASPLRSAHKAEPFVGEERSNHEGDRARRHRNRHALHADRRGKDDAREVDKATKRNIEKYDSRSQRIPARSCWNSPSARSLRSPKSGTCHACRGDRCQRRRSLRFAPSTVHELRASIGNTRSAPQAEVAAETAAIAASSALATGLEPGSIRIIASKGCDRQLSLDGLAPRPCYCAASFPFT